MSAPDLCKLCRASREVACVAGERTPECDKEATVALPAPLPPRPEGRYIASRKLRPW